jgi:hypothetical protein
VFLRGRVVRALGKAAWIQLLLVVVFGFVLGETYMRLPFVGQQLEYEPDREFGGRLAPNQRGFIWLANMSMQSATISLNNDGHRGRATDWSKPVVLVAGDSEWFGAGVSDTTVWTQVLERELQGRWGLEGLQVVNASHPGHGWYHEFVVVRRVLEVRPVQAIVVRVSIAQRSFKAIPPEEQAKRFEQAQTRQRIRRVSKFLPFLVNKIDAQAASVRGAFVPHVFRRQEGGTDWRTAAAAEAMWAEERTWWEQLIALGTVHKSPILFVVHDVEGTAATDVLVAHLEELARSHRNIHVSRLGPDRFGLDTGDRETLRRTVHDVLTLGRDPHGNALQHELVARAVLADADEKGLISQLRASLERSSPR